MSAPGARRGRRVAARGAAPRRLGRLRARAARRGSAARRPCALRVPQPTRRRHGRAPLGRRRRDRAVSRRRSTRRRDARPGGAPTSRSATPSSRYRWLLSGGDVGYAVGERRRRRRARRPRRRRLPHAARRRRPGLAPALGRLRDLPRPLRDAPAPRRRRRRRWAVPKQWGELPTGRGCGQASTTFRRRPPRRRAAPRPRRARSARTRST